MKKYLSMAGLLFCADTFALACGDLVIWNGGISREERESAPTAGTKLVFFMQNGNLVSDVRVLIKDSDGNEVVNTLTQGPWLMLQLSADRYAVLAIWQDGEAQGSYINADGSQQEFGYMFRTE